MSNAAVSAHQGRRMLRGQKPVAASPPATSRTLPPGRRVTAAALRSSWRSALDAAEEAIRAADHFLPPEELRRMAKDLADERQSTAKLLLTFARTRPGSEALAHLALVPREAQRLLGLGPNVAACIFNLDGVLIGSAAVHAEAWAETFGDLWSKRTERAYGDFVPFDVEHDYRKHIHGKPRLDGVRDFLASRGIRLPEGKPGDVPGTETVNALANQKKALFVRLLETRGLHAFAGAQEYLETAHDAHVTCAVMSASSNTDAILEGAGLASLIDARVDGDAIVTDRLQARPLPDIPRAAASRLGVEPRDAAVFETTPAGIAAARAGGFGVVVGVARGDDAQALHDAGAHIVVSGLEELFERERAA